MVSASRCETLSNFDDGCSHDGNWSAFRKSSYSESKNGRRFALSTVLNTNSLIPVRTEYNQQLALTASTRTLIMRM